LEGVNYFSLLMGSIAGKLSMLQPHPHKTPNHPKTTHPTADTTKPICVRNLWHLEATWQWCGCSCGCPCPHPATFRCLWLSFVCISKGKRKQKKNWRAVCGAVHQFALPVYLNRDFLGPPTIARN